MEGNMQRKSKEASDLEENERICISPKVIETIPPEDVAVAILRHFRVIEPDMLRVNEKGETDLRSRQYQYGERRSVHQNSEGITFCVVSEIDMPLISVVLPHEW